MKTKFVLIPLAIVIIGSKVYDFLVSTGKWGRTPTGTYWHHNFGHQMSHGCVNFKTEVLSKLKEADKRVVLLSVLEKVEVSRSRTYAKIRGYLPINYEGKEELNVNYRDSRSSECG